jgi:hypothetical protein
LRCGLNHFSARTKNSNEETVMCNETRRSFLKQSAALAAGTVALRGSAFAAATDPLPATKVTRFTQFEYADVQLLDGPMLEQFQHNHQLFLNLERRQPAEALSAAWGCLHRAKIWVGGTRLGLSLIRRRT